MRIVIIGNSAAGLSALEAFRKVDRKTNIRVVSKETDRPYSKVLLPYFLQGKIPHSNLYIRDENYFKAHQAECIRDRVVKVNPETRQVALESGRTLEYDRLLVASGASPLKPPIAGLDGEGVRHLWNLDDAQALAPYYAKGGKLLVLGSGLVALQAAWAAFCRGLAVCVVELMPRIMPRVLDDHCARILAEQMEKMGVELHTNTLTQKITRSAGGDFLLHTDSGKTLTADFIIVGTGVRPNIDFLKHTNIRTEHGILVDNRMQTSLAGVYAAGDVAQVPSALGSESVVHALWPTAVETGRIAGANMAGKEMLYGGSLNMNVTQMFNMTVAAMGNCIETDGMNTWTDASLPSNQYLKIMLQNGIPVGAASAGGVHLVSTLGLLRPLIREKIRIGADPGRLRNLLAQHLVQHHEAFCH